MTMKTLTAFAAAAMLAASFSVASAQNAANPNQKDPPPSSINSGGYTGAAAKSGSETTGAAEGGAMSKQGKAMGKSSVKGKSRFCSKPRTGSEGLNCVYATRAACQKVAQPGNATCVPNPNLGTTGAGGKMNSGKMK